MSWRRAALDALTDITDKGAYANLRLKSAVGALSKEDAARACALVYTTLEHLYWIDYVLAQFQRGRIQPPVRGTLRLGICALLYMRTPQSAACNESVKLVKEIGKGALAGYVNGVMRAVCRAAEQNALPALPEDPIERMSVQYSYPRELVSLYCDRYGAAFTEAMLSYVQHDMTLRAQPPYTAEELGAWLSGQGVAYTRGAIVPEAFHLNKGFAVAKEPLFTEGSIAVQSESAMLACLVTGVRPGMRVLDACCAPGGKTAFLSALMEGRGSILAWELHPHRAALMEKTLHRLHVANADVAVRDASVYDASLRERMDVVLIDAPCSGLGVPGKPDARYNRDGKAIAALCTLQRAILDACAAYVKPGGTLVYATCTISPAENEAQIAAFLARHAEFHAASLAPYLPEALRAAGETGMVQLFPHLHHTEGFFIAKLERDV